MTPLNLPLKSGKHVVSLSRAGEKVGHSYEVKLFPDRTVRLKYDFTQYRWTLE